MRGSSAEMEHWVPSDAYALANDFRRQHMAQMPMEIFAELLLRLNRVWRAREAKRLERQQVRQLPLIATDCSRCETTRASTGALIATDDLPCM